MATQKLIAHVIAGRREHVFLVSKFGLLMQGTELKSLRSLARLGTNLSPTFTCCIGQTGLRSCRALQRLLRTCVRRERFAQGLEFVSHAMLAAGAIEHRRIERSPSPSSEVCCLPD